MNKIKDILAHLHLWVLIALALALAGVKKVAAKVMSVFHKTKASPVVVAATPKVEAVATALEVQAKGQTPSVLKHEMGYLFTKAKILSSTHRKVLDSIFGVVITLLTGVMAHDHYHRAPKAEKADAPKVVAKASITHVEKTAVVVAVGRVRISELTPDGQVFLATTVAADQIVSADTAGITWHPIPTVTETWHGSYRISK